MSVRFSADRTEIECRFPYDPPLNRKMLSASGRWDGKDRCWRLPVTLSAAQKIDESGPLLWPIAGDVRSTLDALYAESLIRAEASAAGSAEFFVNGLGGVLRPYQQAGVAYAVRAKRTWIADEQGLGKTIEALAVVKHLQTFPVMIACTATTIYHWKQFAEFWIPGCKVWVGDGEPAGHDFIVMTHAALAKWAGNYGHVHEPYRCYRRPGGVQILVCPKPERRGQRDIVAEMNPRAFIGDEAHKLKTSKAMRTQAALAITKSMEVVLLLTGTPLPNRPKELIAQLRIMRRLDDMGGYFHFVNRYCQAKQTPFGLDTDGAADDAVLLELNQKLRETCYIRREKSLVMPELPPKQRTVEPFVLTNRSEYMRLESAVANDDAGYGLAAVEKLKQCVVRGKLPAVTEWISEFVENGSRLLVYVTHTAVGRHIAGRFGAPFLFGDVTPIKRYEMVKDFQSSPPGSVFVANLQAGGEGIDGLQHVCSNVAFVEFGWNPKDHDQAEDRLHRDGQDDSVNCWYLVAPDTIEEELMRIIEGKRVVVNAVTRGETSDAEAKRGMLSGLSRWLKGRANAA